MTSGSDTALPTWLVTGAAGFLGENAGLWLRGRAALVGQVRREGTRTQFPRQYPVDLRDAEAAAEMVRTIRPNVILHAAAVSGHQTCADDPDQAFAVNVEASRALGAAAAETGAHVIYISTDAVFSGSRGGYTETDEPEPFSYYGETKLAGEHAVRENGASVLVARTNFFGWSSSGTRSVLEFFVNQLRAGEPVKGYPDFIVTSIYVQSLVETLWQLTASGAQGVVHVASSDAVSKHDFGVTVARVFGLDETLISPLRSDLDGHATSRSRNISLNTDLLASMLGSPPPTQEAGIARSREQEAPLRRRLSSALAAEATDD